MEQEIQRALKSPAIEEVKRILQEADQTVIWTISEPDESGFVVHTFHALSLDNDGVDYTIDISFNAPQDVQLPDGIVEESISIVETITRES